MRRMNTRLKIFGIFETLNPIPVGLFSAFNNILEKVLVLEFLQVFFNYVEKTT